MESLQPSEAEEVFNQIFANLHKGKGQFGKQLMTTGKTETYLATPAFIVQGFFTINGIVKESDKAFIYQGYRYAFHQDQPCGFEVQISKA